MKYIRKSRAIFAVFILIFAGVGSAFAQPDEKSVARMSELIAAQPNSDNLYIQRGNIYLYLKRTAEALADVQKALSINPTSSDAIFLRGKIKVEQRDNDGAIADISQAIASAPSGYPLAYLMRAELYEKKGDLRRAYADYVKLDELTDNPKAAQGTARLESKLKTAGIDPASPIPIETKGENKEAWAAFQTADKFIKKLDWQAAINEYSKAIALDPEFAVAYANRARIYGNISKFDLAIADYAEAIRLKPNYADAFESRGGLYYIYNKPDLALADYTEAIRLVANFSDAYLNRGRVYSQLNQNGKAVADWEKFLQLAPNSSNAELVRDYLASIRRSTSSTSTANSAAASSPTNSSKCVFGDCRTGYGKIVVADGSGYEGNFVNGNGNGKGKMTFVDGSVYEGDFVQGLREGMGTFTFTNGEVHIGQFSKDKMNGKGKQILANGSIYEGSFVNNNREGQGTFTFKNGNYYTGEYKNDKRNGYGRSYNKSTNNTQEGTWKDGVFVGSSPEKTSITETEWQKLCEPFVGKMETAVNTKEDDDLAIQTYADFDAATKDAGTSTSVRNTRKALLKTMHRSNRYPLIEFVRDELETLNYNEEETKDILSPRLYYV